MFIYSYLGDKIILNVNCSEILNAPLNKAFNKQENLLLDLGAMLVAISRGQLSRFHMNLEI